MMDIAHLEKMGRELKCPICLSLLKSVVTLACNHAFCNSCIKESMRSVSSCPVCKVPFRRREVRPAPHMDNLVSIYISMEAASGFNIFTSQVAPPKNSEEPLQVADDKNTYALDSIMVPQSSSRGKRLSKGKRKKMEKVDSRTSNPCPPTRPCFSSNKRIHVTPYPVSETPIPPKRANKLTVSNEDDTDIIELEHNKYLSYKRPEGPALQPFFWLREANEEDEGLEIKITPEMTSLTTPKNVPCFSDIKDFDDVGTPKKMTPTSKSVAQEAFDSEMFEWTQRACSPELFSTPLKKQNTAGKRFNRVQEENCRQIIPGNNNNSRGLESLKTCHLDEDNKTTILTCKRKGTLKKRHKQNKEKKEGASTHETARISLNEHHPFGSNEMVEDSSQEKEPSKQMGPLRCSRKAYKKIQGSHKKQHSSTHNVMQEDDQKCMNLQRCCVSSRSKDIPHPTMNEVVRKCKDIYSPIKCAFCHSSNDLENLLVSGEIMSYCDGKSVAADYNGGVNVIHTHKNCTEWAPDVYFKDDLVINLSTELARSRRITCICCGIKGAALGCFEKSCRRSFHYPCAKQTPECRWDNENFVMLCPLHSSSKLPSEMSELQKLNRKISASKGKVLPPSQLKATNDRSSVRAWPAGSTCKWVLCSSALSGVDKEILSEFARLTGISISKAWSSVVTHVIASTDENGACKRTLKFLMGILDGKWILNIEWIKSCMKSMKPVNEEKYEIAVDVHGIRNGPRHGRMRIINKEPKLLSGFWFYLFGDFSPSYKGYLQDLITAGGGKMLLRRPISSEFKKKLDDSSYETFIVYSLEFPENKQNQYTKVLDHRRAEAIALAKDCGAKVVTNFWILDSIAASTLQVLPS